MRTARPLVAVVLAFVAVPAHLTAQQRMQTRSVVQTQQDYEITGIEAWTAARTNGFTFRPIAVGDDQSTSRPYDGVNTRLTATVPDNRFGGLVTTRATVARVVGGNMSVSRPGMTVAFEMFGERTLAPGWTVQEVELSGGYVWDRRPESGSRDLAFRVKLSGATSGASTIIRSVTLRGPRGADWEDAFVGRTLYTITGVEAWETAHRYGFEFYPNHAGCGGRDVRNPACSLSSADGARSVLTIQGARHFELGARCIEVPGRPYCLRAQVVGGVMSVPALGNLPGTYSDELTADFVMYGAQRLAPGWVLKDVDIAGGTILRSPAVETDDLSFEVQLRSYRDRGATAFVRTITLEGPSNAESWQEAFKVR